MCSRSPPICSSTEYSTSYSFAQQNCCYSQLQKNNTGSGACHFSQCFSMLLAMNCTNHLSPAEWVPYEISATTCSELEWFSYGSIDIFNTTEYLHYPNIFNIFNILISSFLTPPTTTPPPTNSITQSLTYFNKRQLLHHFLYRSIRNFS
jgi:hypothetical protein